LARRKGIARDRPGGEGGRAPRRNVLNAGAPVLEAAVIAAMLLML
jgi:hypothetical protein